MIEIAHLLTLANAFEVATGVSDKTLSSRVFADSKKLTALRDGSDITTGRFNTAIHWFSDNWPKDVEWPANVERPQIVEAQP